MRPLLLCAIVLNCPCRNAGKRAIDGKIPAVVVSTGQMILVSNLVIHFAKECVDVVRGVENTLLRNQVRWQAHGTAKPDRQRLMHRLLVVSGEEKRFVLSQWPTDCTSELLASGGNPVSKNREG